MKNTEIDTEIVSKYMNLSKKQLISIIIKQGFGIIDKRLKKHLRDKEIESHKNSYKRLQRQNEHLTQQLKDVPKIEEKQRQLDHYVNELSYLRYERDQYKEEALNYKKLYRECKKNKNQS